MMVIASRYLVPKGYAAMAVYPFILVHKKDLRLHRVLINHERIHLRQQAELLVLLFYLWYIAEFLIRLIIYRDSHKAYRNICFEREAYANEGNEDYLLNRPVYRFTKYLILRKK